VPPPRHAMRRLLIPLALLAALAAPLLLLGEWLTRAVPAVAPSPPRRLDAEPVRIAYAGGELGGWFVAGRPDMGGVLLLHGIRSSRRQMIGRAGFLRRAGYASLLVDLPAHGESSGARIGLGATEAPAVAAALAHLRDRLPGAPLAVIGVSLGAAAFVLADLQPRPAAVVLESMYPTLHDAVANRLELRLGDAGRVLAAPLLWQLPLRLGVAASALEPVRHLPALATPVAIAAGTRDRHTTWAETRRLYAAARMPKELWSFPGIAHEDLHRHAPALYEARVLAFLGRHLAPPRDSLP